MALESNRERVALYRDVDYEQLSPGAADDQLKQMELEPFESRLDPSRFDPMQEVEWTLPMTAA